MVMIGCARQKTYKETQALYKLCGFNDKNENGTIEKPSISNLWLADEGYNKKADINDDGKIVEAEAKFYLWSLLITSPGEKQKNPLTTEDKNTLRPLFNEKLKTISAIKDPKQRTSALAWLASDMAKAGLFKESLAILRSVGDDHYKAGDINILSSEIAKTKLSRTALKEILKETFAVAQTIEDPHYRSAAIGGLASEMINVKLFREMLDATRTIESIYDRSSAIGDIALELAKTKMFKEALETARTIEEPYYRSKAINDIASGMVEAGMANKETSKVFIEAIKAARTIDDLPIKLSVVSEIASGLVKVDKPALNVLFNEDLRTVRSFDDLHDRSIAISEVALEMAKAGTDKNTLRKTFKEALDLEGAYTNKLFRENVDDRMRDIFLDNEHGAINGILYKMSVAGLDSVDIERVCKDLKTDIRFRTANKNMIGGPK
jgi:hypothetical protein